MEISGHSFFFTIPGTEKYISTENICNLSYPLLQQTPDTVIPCQFVNISRVIRRMHYGYPAIAVRFGIRSRTTMERSHRTSTAVPAAS